MVSELSSRRKLRPTMPIFWRAPWRSSELNFTSLKSPNNHNNIHGVDCGRAPSIIYKLRPLPSSHHHRADTFCRQLINFDAV